MINWLKRKCKRFFNPVQVGDVWSMHSKNPFDNLRTRYKVLEIENGFVKYEVISTECTFTSSSSVAFFLIGNNLVSEQQ